MSRSSRRLRLPARGCSMRAWGWLPIAAALSGCAAHRAPVPQAPEQTASTDWAQVRAIPTGTEVLVSGDGAGDRHGLMCRVTDTTLTIREVYALNAIPRVSVARVTTRVVIGYERGPWYLYIPAGAILGGLAGLVVAAVERDKTI